MKVLFIGLGLLALSLPAFAQTGTPSSRLGWDQPNSTLVDAQSYTYRVFPDGAATGVVLTGVTCAAGTPVTCSAPFPAFTPGPHTLTMSASNAAGSSPLSASFAFTFVVLPVAPAAIRIE